MKISQSQQKKRETNFSNAKIDLLIDACEKYQNVLENKSTNATTWKEKNEV